MPVINASAGSDDAMPSWDISGLAQTFRIPAVVTRAITTTTSNILLSARDDKCDKGDASLCEKPVAASHVVVGVVVGSVVALVVITVSLLTFLHCRRARRDARDDAAHAHELADYGMDPLPVKKPRKAARRQEQPVQDDNGGYDAHGLAPPARRMSSDSLSSLARSIRGREDPFGSGAELAQTDSGSMHHGGGGSGGSGGAWKEEGARRPAADPFR